MPARPMWLGVLCGGLLQYPPSMPNAQSISSQYDWQSLAPWKQIQQLSPLLLDMTPSDVSAFVPAAARTGFNPVALLIMAVAKHPVFVANVSELICTHSLEDPAGMARAIRSTVTGLSSDEDDINLVDHVCTASMAAALTRLGSLELDDSKAGILLGGSRYKVVVGVPSILQDCFDTATSHHFPDVTTASDIPAYLDSWVLFLARLPPALNVGNDSDSRNSMAITEKLMLWLRSSFPDASPTTVDDASAWWPVSSRLKACSVVALLSPSTLSAHSLQCACYVLLR